MASASLNTSAPDQNAQTEDNGNGWFLFENIWVMVGVALVLVLLGGVLIAVLVNRKRKKGRHYNYWSLDSLSIPSKIELEHQKDTVQLRDTALLSCSFFLRSKKEYKLMDHLVEIGSRERKQWFLLRHKKTNSDKLLSIMPVSVDMPLPLSRSTAKSLRDISSHLKHPYLLPVDEIAFQDDKQHVVIVQPCCKDGSLKDYIYSSHWIESYDDKYNNKSPSLELFEVKKFCSQILEAMRYLKEKGFPWHGHLHSGNVLIQDGICRLSGYESMLCGYPSKVRQLMKPSVQQDNKCLDVHSFGHIVFEMLFGEELGYATPDSDHYRALNNSLVVEFLSFIFTRHAGEFPSLKKISKHPFLHGMWLPEIGLYPPDRSPLPSNLKQVFKAIKKAHGVHSKTNRNISRASSIQSLKSQSSSRLSRHSSSSATERSGLLASTTDTQLSATTHKSKRNAQLRFQATYGSTTAAAVAIQSDDVSLPLAASTRKSMSTARSQRLREFHVDSQTSDAIGELAPKQSVINGNKSALIHELIQGVRMKKSTDGTTSEEV